MSDNTLFLVPVDPQWQPARGAAEKAVALLRTMGDPDAIDYEFFDVIQLFHPYGNWDGATCPHCGADVDEWFHESVDRLIFTAERTCLEAATLYCGRAVSLNDLNFVWPCGFGRFVLRCENAGAMPDAHQRSALEWLLGSKLREVWQHL
jgi:hypothetical protein